MKYTIGLLTLLLAGGLCAQTAGWKHLPGPAEGYFMAIETTSDGTVYAVSSDGRIFYKSPSDADWQVEAHIATQFGYNTSKSVVPDLGGNSYITSSNGLYRSSNGGADWVTAISNHVVVSVVRASSGTLFAAANIQSNPTGTAVFRSSDNGQTWDSLFWLPAMTMDIAVDTKNRCYFSLYSYTTSVVRYDASTKLLKTFNSPLDASTAQSYPACHLAMISDVPIAQFFGATYIITPDDHWQKRSDSSCYPYPYFNTSMLLQKDLVCSKQGTIYSLIYRSASSSVHVKYSNDTGATWADLNTTMFVGNDGAGMMSIDSSGNFFLGFYNYNTQSVIQTPGIYKTADRGNSWQQIGLPIANISRLDEGPLNILYADEYSNGYRNFQSTDEGASWPDLTNAVPLPLGYFSKAADGGFYYFTDGYGTGGSPMTIVWRSEPTSPTQLVRQTELIENLPLTTAEFGGRYYVLFNTQYSSGFFSSVLSTDLMVTTDRGISWDLVPTPQTATALTGFAADAAGLLYVGFHPALYRSSDAGTSWTKLQTGIFDATISVIKIVDSKTIVLGTLGEGVWHSIDGGSSFQQWYGGTADSIIAIEVTAHTCYAATKVGLLSCDLNSDSWKPELFIDEHYPITQLLLTSGRHLYATSPGLGIWTTDSTVNSVGRTPSSASASGLGLDVLFDPVSGRTDVAFSLAAAGHASVGLYDMLGREIRTLADGFFDASVHRLTRVNGELQGGVYNIVLTSGSAVAAKKLVVTR